MGWWLKKRIDYLQLEICLMPWDLWLTKQHKQRWISAEWRCWTRFPEQIHSLRFYEFLPLPWKQLDSGEIFWLYKRKINGQEWSWLNQRQYKRRKNAKSTWNGRLIDVIFYLNKEMHPPITGMRWRFYVAEPSHWHWDSVGLVLRQRNDGT